MEDSALKILIAEDSLADRLILESIIVQAGHNVFLAQDGQEAVDAYNSYQPDIVLLDVIMPNMGGLDAAKHIREQTEDELVPILFLTSLTDNESLVDCIEAGGNDFIPKPYNAVVLTSKIKAFASMRELHKTLAAQKQQIELHNQHLMQEHTVAKQVFDQIAHTGCLDDGYLRFYMSPLAVFNGDVIVADISPTGSLFVLLGDFTGHGLPAAIGSMPLASTFYGMVRKGFSVADIMREINQKLHEILPVGFFCCATCLDINVKQRRLRYWNGGLPASLLYRSNESKFEELSSKNLPLGVLPSKNFNDKTERVSLEFGDKIYLWSDGIFEARNSEGEMFGEDNLHAFINSRMFSNDLFSDVLARVQSHIGETEKDDDISLIEVPFEDIEFVSKHQELNGNSGERLADWSLHFQLEASTLKQFDPLPLVTNILNEVNGLTPHRTLLYTVIAELYSNALEHGILELSSDIKQTPQGFVEYYAQRGKLLDELEQGYVIFDITHEQGEDSKGLYGRLTIRVRDSGSGFGVESDVSFVKDTSDKQASEDVGEHRYFGRGLTLMKNTCESVCIHAPGNDIEVVFAWHEHDR